MAQKYDLFHGPPGRRHSVKPNVVLSSYETVLKERGLFQVRWARCCLGKKTGWGMLVIDAHGAAPHRMRCPALQCSVRHPVHAMCPLSPD